MTRTTREQQVDLDQGDTDHDVAGHLIDRPTTNGGLFKIVAEKVAEAIKTCPPVWR